MSLEFNKVGESITYHYCGELASGQISLFTGHTSDKPEQKKDIKNSLTIQTGSSVYIPNKVLTLLRRHTSKKKLKEIHKDLPTAIELCLIIVANLADTYHRNTEWKHLRSREMKAQTGYYTNMNVYVKIVDLLVDRGVISVNKYFERGVKSRKYKLTDVYANKGVKEYELQTELAVKLRKKTLERLLKAKADNPIVSNLLEVKNMVELPTEEEIWEEAKRLTKAGWRNKKGQKLTIRHRHSDDYWKDTNRVFVEDHIKIYRRLTQGGIMVPRVGGHSSGGRVVDSFNLMPSWIRSLIKINGERIKEVDCTALHPNISMKLYGGNLKNITHEKVAEVLGEDLKAVKIEHLAFFNKPWESMQESALFDFYQKHCPTALQNLKRDKHKNGYEVTSRRLFREETELMASVIERLNGEGVYVLYVYDALYCDPKDAHRVRQVMNQQLISKNIFTSVK